jgi:hypothetical protein
MGMQAVGAWLTDIDDTLIPSGVFPEDGFVHWLGEFLRTLRSRQVLWVPASGVTLDRLGPRLLFRLPPDVLPGVRYYGGDGSLKYRYDSRSHRWREEQGFSRLLSDAQALAIIGQSEWPACLGRATVRGPDAGSADHRLDHARQMLARAGLPERRGILDELKDALRAEGYDPQASVCYFRGGSVSWLMLGDTSAEPYREPRAAATRARLLDLARGLLAERRGLRAVGDTGVCLPFPGARGIKFVLEGIDKERAVRDLMAREGLAAQRLLYAGNEIFAGGNDDRLRRIEGITLLSLGEKTDAGPGVVDGCLAEDRQAVREVEANRRWMDYTRRALESGTSWPELLEDILRAGAALLKVQ